jgi:hypothetical protein
LTHHDECLIADYSTVGDNHRTPVRILLGKIFYGVWEATDIHNTPFIAPTVEARTDLKLDKKGMYGKR